MALLQMPPARGGPRPVQMETRATLHPKHNGKCEQNAAGVQMCTEQQKILIRMFRTWHQAKHVKMDWKLQFGAGNAANGGELWVIFYQFFESRVQCLHSLKGLALPRASHSGEIALAGSRHLRSTLAAASILSAHVVVTEIKNK